MSKTKVLRELVNRHAPAEVIEKLKAVETLEVKLSELKAKRHGLLHDLISPHRKNETHLAERNGHGVPF